jgi:hypothetical protein
MEDNLRNKLDFAMYCSKHPNEKLTFSTELSNIKSNSAYELNLKIVVHPCNACQRETEKITDAVNVLLAAQKN